MSYRKDSRMGDEMFATGAAIAPFVIVLMKKILTKVMGQKPIDPTLPPNEKFKLEKRNLRKKVNFWKNTGIVCLILEALVFLMGNATFADIIWFLVIGFCYYRNSKKLEAMKKS